METTKQRDQVKLVCRGLYDAQKLRIQLQLRIERLVRDGIMTKEAAKGFLALPFKHFEQAEEIMAKVLWKEIKDEPIVVNWLVGVKGIGPRLSGLLIANIGDISRFATVSKLWAYCGQGIVDGRAVKRTKNQKGPWSSEMKTTCWKIGQSFVKAGGPYREMYDTYKTRITQRELNKGNIIYGSTGEHKVHAAHIPEGVTVPDPLPKSGDCEWTLGRINNMSTRYVAKQFLSHLWQVWHEIEGLPMRDPYCKEYLGHTTMVDPWAYSETPRQAAVA